MSYVTSVVMKKDAIVKLSEPEATLSPCNRKRATVFLLSAVMLYPLAATAAKVDTVLLENGDLVTGEVKSLKQGKLSYGTDSMGTISIEWDDITQVTAKAYYRIETSDGSRYFGSIGPADGEYRLAVERDGQKVLLDMQEVVSIKTIENGFRDRTDSTLQAGYSYNKASDVTQFNLAYDAEYVAELYRVNAGASSTVTDDGDETTSKALAYTDVRRWLKDRNYWLATGGAEHNEELGLDLRVVAGGGFGRRFLRTNRAELFGEAGALVNRTESSDGSADTEFEGLLRGGWSIFIYDTPKTSLDTELAVFPGLTNFGEYRTQFDISLRQEIIEDFFWDLGFYHQYDSDVADDEASSSDYGITTSVGYEF